MIHSKFKEIAQQKHESKMKTPYQDTATLKAITTRLNTSPTLPTIEPFRPQANPNHSLDDCFSYRSCRSAT
ncbi:MAG TPA: hypothetical protein DEF45_15990 [Rhodopirellula sp.]|nr:hypothetical protein [Rhodopirellula sp.]